MILTASISEGTMPTCIWHFAEADVDMVQSSGSYIITASQDSKAIVNDNMFHR